MHTKLLSVLSVIAVLWALPVLALDLQQARVSGAVGEKRDGYVAALQSSPDVAALAAQVNGKRKQEYARISKENGQPVNVVAKLAAQQVINKLPPGALYEGEDGSWKKR